MRYRLEAQTHPHEESKTKMLIELKEHSKVYYLHRNDVRYKKVLRGCKKYYLDKLEDLAYFNKKEKNNRVKMNYIQEATIELTKTLGLYFKNPNYAIYLTSFLFCKEIHEAIDNEYLTGLFTRCYNNHMKNKVKVITQTIVKFSTTKLKDFLGIKEMAYLLDYYLENGAQEFFSDEFYTDICIELKKRTDEILFNSS